MRKFRILVFAASSLTREISSGSELSSRQKEMEGKVALLTVVPVPCSKLTITGTLLHLKKPTAVLVLLTQAAVNFTVKSKVFRLKRQKTRTSLTGSQPNRYKQQFYY